jgi:hypothetical protein
MRPQFFAHHPDSKREHAGIPEIPAAKICLGRFEVWLFNKCLDLEEIVACNSLPQPFLI